ncbi:hypothetical protein M514_08504 [Trichuris suis]|uniref:Reverse transcriptase domain-containing protein n=1 Tax=Trichuris suis TaxID=68888 RepID=A0A085NA14_9BILA|nr:hypothetical protein M514_08504 [Trichuris suis]
MHEGNYFRSQDSFFSQKDGAPMGSPLSPILAEIFMEHLEEKAFSTLHVSDTPIFFKRYVDDIFAIVKTGREETLLEHLNSLFPNQITLTIEKESNHRLPSLDVLVIKEGNKLKTTVYRKPTHSDRHLHFSSHHPASVKRGIVKGMVDRALAVCDPTYLNAELSHILNTLRCNGYPTKFVTSIIRQCKLNKSLPPVPPNNQQCPVLVLPYYSELSEKIRRLGHSLNFNVQFKSSCNLRSTVRSDKIKVPFDSRPGVVYEIKCGCNASYIGETGNTLFRRFDQHMSNVLTYKNAERRLNGEPTIGPGRPPTVDPRKAMAKAIKASVVVEHASQCSLDPPKIICRESLFHLRRIKEALYIKSNFTINRDNGVAVSEVWSALINKFQCCTLPS